MVKLAFGADAVFFARIAGLQVAQAAQLTFNRHPHRVGHLHHLAGDLHVVIEAGRCLAVLHERAVHHHRTEAQANGSLTHLGARAMILVHDQRNLRIGLHRRLNQMLDEALARILARPSAGLQDDRRADFGSSGHHRLHLLEVVDVEGRNAVAVFRGMVEQLAHGNERHGDPLV